MGDVAIGPQAQCDQMARLVFQYLAMHNNENLLKSIQIVPTGVHNFANYERNLINMAKYVLIFTKMVKFRQI